jgi:hypothetical protein
MVNTINPGDEFVFDDGERGIADIDGIPVTRLGWDTMRRLTKKLCDAVNKFAPLLRRILPDDSPVLMWLDIASVTCAWAVTWLPALADEQPVSVVDGSKQQLVADLRNLLDKWDTTTT